MQKCKNPLTTGPEGMRKIDEDFESRQKCIADSGTGPAGTIASSARWIKWNLSITQSK